MKKTLLGIAALGAASSFFLTKYPPLGKAPNPKRKAQYRTSPNFRHNKFHNLLPATVENDLQFYLTLMRDFLQKNPHMSPETVLPVQPYHWSKTASSTQAKATWFGHSTILVELNGAKIFIDPMLGQSPSPFPRIGTQRYSPGLPFDISNVPPVDIVLYSHDHYDHLDYRSVSLLKDRAGIFIVPLGVGSRLEGWGVPSWKIKELDWWEMIDHKGIRFTSAPARHFSGRSLFDQDCTLWSSWVMESQETKIFFSGDSGYGPHFKEIGDKFGPFDLTMMECGQYDTRWADLHMFPEETVQAHKDVQGKLLLPIHWAGFTMAFNPWTDSIERVMKATNEQDIKITTPRIGETIIIGDGNYPDEQWWKSI